MLSHTLMLAESGGLAPRLNTRFSDGHIARLVGADGVQEFPLALVALGAGAPAIQAAGDATIGTIDRAPIEFPLVTLAQRAGNDDRLGPSWPSAPPLEGEPPPSEDLDTVILRRGSARSFDPGASVDGHIFEFSLAASLRGTQAPHFIAVHALTGSSPGSTGGRTSSGA
jgi:hypothetical protein